MLGEAAQTAWKLLRSEKLGKVRLVFAELVDGPTHKHGLENLLTSLGVPWPAKDEFEIGATLEHAGYFLPWLAAFFGPAKCVTAYASCLIPDKLPGVILDPPDAADFTVGCIEFHSGVVARITCGSVGSHDHSFTAFGDDRVLRVEEAWNYGASIRMRPHFWNRDCDVKHPLHKFSIRVWRKLVRHFRFLKNFERFSNPHGRKVPLVRDVPDFDWEMGLRMDFSRGIQEMADAIDENREARISTRFSLHVTELALAIHYARELKQPYQMTTTFSPVEPMSWAK